VHGRAIVILLVVKVVPFLAELGLVVFFDLSDIASELDYA